MNISSNLTRPLVAGRDYPELRGTVKLTLHNCRHHTDDLVIEKHNTVTNALADIFAANYGGLLNYNNFADLYKTWLGGVLVFGSALDTSTPNDYGIPANASNAIVAHAGQTPMTSQADDTTRGDPDDTKTGILSASSYKLAFEWGTSAGNGTISALGLTHTDVGSYGAGRSSTAQKSLAPFANVGAISRSYAYGDNGNYVLAINDNTAYSFYLADNTTVNIYITPINANRFKLQGSALTPITSLAQTVTATLPNSYAITGAGSCYYYFDFANNNLVLFGVPTAQGDTLYKDVISLADGTVTHSTITVTGAKLWKFYIKGATWAAGSDYGNVNMSVPVPAMLLNGYLYVYTCATYKNVIDGIVKINLAQTTDITQLDSSAIGLYSAEVWADSWTLVNGRHTTLGGLIVNNSFIINGNTVYPTAQLAASAERNYNFALSDKVSAPVFSYGTEVNMLSVCKMYLATKFNLDDPVVKNATQSMTIEYTLTES